MKERYYLIYVTTHTAERGSPNDHCSYGYFCGTYNVNKSTFVGSDSQPDYERVVRYKTRKAAETKVAKLKSMNFGGEGIDVDYDFDIVEMELEPIQSKELSKSNKELVNSIENEFTERVKDITYELIDKYKGELAYEDYKETKEVILTVATKLLKSLGKI